MDEIGSISRFTAAYGPGSGWDDDTFDGSEFVDGWDGEFGTDIRGELTHATS